MRSSNTCQVHCCSGQKLRHGTQSTARPFGRRAHCPGDYLRHAKINALKEKSALWPVIIVSQPEQVAQVAARRGATELLLRRVGPLQVYDVPLLLRNYPAYLARLPRQHHIPCTQPSRWTPHLISGNRCKEEEGSRASCRPQTV